jgi:hypothetical protein
MYMCVLWLWCAKVAPLTVQARYLTVDVAKVEVHQACTTFLRLSYDLLASAKVQVPSRLAHAVSRNS